MIKKFPRFIQLRYPLIALAMIIALLVMHSHLSSKSSFAVTSDRVQTVTITNAGFMPNQLRFHEGDLISLMLVNTDTRPHNLVVSGLKVASTSLQTNQSTTIQFTAAKKGTFDYISDNPGYPEAGYRGQLIIQ